MRYLSFLLLVFCLPVFVYAAPVPMDKGLVLEVKNQADMVKLRWLVTDKKFDYNYVLSRASLKTPENRQVIARLHKVDFAAAKVLLADNEAALKLMFPFKTAANRAEMNQSLAQNDNRLNMLLYLSVLKPTVAKALGQYYEDPPPADAKAVLYTLEVFDRDKLVHTKTRGINLDKPKDSPMLWGVKAHRFDWGIGLKWQGYEAYTSFNIYRSDSYDGEYKKVNKVPLQVQVSRNDDGTINVAPYFYTDTTLVKGQVAFYKVQGLDFFSDPGPKSIGVMGQVKTDPRPTPLRRPEIKSGETEIALSWEKSVDEDVVGYNVYRSFNYEDKGEKLNKQLLAAPFFTDTVVPLDINIFYAITAVNKGGYESLPSLNGHGLARDATPPPVVQGAEGEVDKATVKLHWNGVQADDLLGYRVYRTMKPANSDWALLNNEPVVEPLFDDALAKNLSRYPYYYRITAVDTHHNEAAPSMVVKIQLPDVTPPRPPAFSGSSVREGNVSLIWNNVAAYDLAGYNIYRSMDGKRVKITKTLVTLPSFVDSQPPLARSVLYEVTAVDKTGNESNPSNPLNLQVRDHKAPNMAQFSAAVDKQKVILTVISKDTDLAGYDVLRSRNSRDFVQINRSRVKDSTFVDPNVLDGKRYFYKVLLWDKAGNRTESMIRPIKVQ